ncbi:MAG: hypothetical protein UT48_C0001G0083 [Parcubacteria group bacterium GW2011_GWE2_39_37]|uniref:Uncharacterized protein n=1 Tax=Candidatus Falkowbacteria bacterium GW2011_GWF2_39_8 TaxID=1618642 RepID=A0A0G0Q0M3_9BACT|nr:MAG: hypothetical protein UT48_C0001G0083 [Parcubacteria group bacterium GW2011_GWE2_39_37]KKR33708.1 MAG: hypothetical protein UT64_C0004G0015 [Candidatus Falkowbacteria bacterium GW2011_GWF2_39_8]
MKISKSKQVGIFLAAIHAILVVRTVFNIISAKEDDWPMLWLLFPFIDFPYSLIGVILTGFISQFFDSINIYEINLLPYPLNDINNFILPFIIFGVFGTIWYFYLPQIISAHMANRNKQISITDYFKKILSKK